MFFSIKIFHLADLADFADLFLTVVIFQMCTICENKYV